MTDEKAYNFTIRGFQLLGLIAFFVGIFMCFSVFNYSNKIETTGYIVELEPTRILYIVDGKEYISKVLSYSSSFYIGKEIEIYYDKDNIKDIGIKSMDRAWIMVPLMGLLFMVIGATPYVYKKFKKNKNNKLLKNSLKVKAEYLKTELNANTYINGINPYKIICIWKDPNTNNDYVFKSKNILDDPEKIISDKKITTFDVYINKKNNKKYYMDINNVLEELGEDIDE